MLDAIRQLGYICRAAVAKLENPIEWDKCQTEIDLLIEFAELCPPHGKSPKSYVVSKIDVALAQLESAIWLWFTKGDPVAIRALSEAGLDCYYSLCKHNKMDSISVSYLQLQSKSAQKREATVRNFFKHGWKELTGKVSINPIYAEVQLFECVCCHVDLTETVTPLMRLYATRFTLEQSSILPPDLREKWLAGVARNKFGEVEIAKMSRTEFFQQLLPIAQQFPASHFAIF